MTKSAPDDDSPWRSGERPHRDPGCAWCGLPVSVIAPPETGLLAAAATEDCYCCFGCRLAHALTAEQGQPGGLRSMTVRLGLSVFFSMNLMAFTMTMWSLDVYDVESTPLQTALFAVFRWLSLLLSLPVLVLLGVPLLRNALHSLRQPSFFTDLLILTGVTAAAVVSAIHVVQGTGDVYFEVAASVLVMVTLGRWLEATGRYKAARVLDDLTALLPTRVRLAGPAGNDDPVWQEADSADVRTGDWLQVRAGERLAVDGLIRHGATTLDEQVFSGESTPVARTVGDRVLAGTVNLDGTIVVEATSEFRAGSFGRLLQILQDARLSRTAWQRLADRVVRWFFPLVAGLSVATLLLHLSQGFGVALQNALSVLLIACPCALGLATPLAIWTALGTAARHQVLFRHGDAMERLAAVQALAIDKTGTLTTGTPQVRHLCILDDHDSPELLPACSALAAQSTHPFSCAIAEFIRDWPGPIAREIARAPAVQAADGTADRSALRLTQVRSVPGGGVEALLPDGRRARLGSPQFAIGTSQLPHRLKLRIAHALSIADQEAASVVAMTIGDRPMVLFLLTETLRPEAPRMLRHCLQQSLPVVVLTGDRSARADQLRRSLLDCHTPGCQCSAECAAARSTADHLHAEQPEAAQSEPPHAAPQVGPHQPPAADSRLTIHCDLRPEEKVQRLLAMKDRYSVVAMTGDGINDAPALAAADVGLAMGCGADVSRESADVCLLSNDLSRIPWAIDLARRTTVIIRQNLFWAFAYNSVGVAMAACGLLNPTIAAALMIGSSLLVIGNSLRLTTHELPPDPASLAPEPAAKRTREPNISTSGASRSGSLTGDPA